MICVKMFGNNPQKLLTSETFLELSGFCFVDKVKPLHRYYYEDESIVQCASKNFSMTITPMGVFAVCDINNDSLYQDTGYILPSNFGLGWKPYYYVRFATGETGIFVEDDKIGIIKEPVRDIRDVVRIKKVIDASDAQWQYMDQGYDRLVVKAVFNETRRNRKA